MSGLTRSLLLGDDTEEFPSDLHLQEWVNDAGDVGYTLTLRDECPVQGVVTAQITLNPSQTDTLVEWLKGRPQ